MIQSILSTKIHQPDLIEHIFVSSCCARPEAIWDTSPQEKICCDFGPGGPGKYIYPTTYNITVKI